MNIRVRSRKVAAGLALVLLSAGATRASAQELPARPLFAPASGLPTAGSDQAPAPSTTADASIAVPDPFVHAFSNLWTDLRHVPSIDTALVLGIGGALALASHPSDRSVTFDASHSKAADEILDGGATIGAGLVQLGGAAATYAIARLAHSPRFTAFGADLVRAQALNAVLTQGLKVAVQRTRPDGASYSFPSGHASASFASATVVAKYFGWKAAVPAYAIAGYVAGSRLSENRHYLSDVIFGASVGVVAAQSVTLGRTRFAVVPTAGAHSLGVALVAIGSK